MKLLRIHTTSGRFRRAGRAFTKQPVEIPFEDLSKAQIEALKAEPMLSVEEIGDDESKKKPAKTKADEPTVDKESTADADSGSEVVSELSEAESSDSSSGSTAPVQSEVPAKKAAKKKAAKKKVAKKTTPKAK